MNKEVFFDKIRKSLFKKLNQKQAEGIKAFLDYWHTLNIDDNRKLAYILATVYHETAFTMQPIEEFGKGKGKPYGTKIKMNGKPYIDTDNIFYGRGHVQLTWYDNYLKAGKLLSADLISNPEIMLNLKESVIVTTQGMLTGMFTGKRLSDYFNGRTTSPRQARRIVNGLDCAAKIAGYYSLFLSALP